MTAARRLGSGSDGTDGHMGADGRGGARGTDGRVGAGGADGCGGAGGTDGRGGAGGRFQFKKKQVLDPKSARGGH